MKIKLTGSDYYDKKLVAELSGIPLKDIKTKYVWHHLDDFNPMDGTCTMQLVDMSIHTKCSSHTGAVEIVRQYFPDADLYSNRK